MKKTTDKTLIDALDRLAHLSEERRRIEREEKGLKALFKKELEARGTSSLEAGSWVFSVREVLRRPLSEELLLKELGSLEPFRKEQKVLQTSVSPAEAPESLDSSGSSESRKAGGAS